VFDGVSVTCSQAEIFVELNGQPRVVIFPNRAAASIVKQRRNPHDPDPLATSQ
jgi:hypothetical protein